MASENTSIDSCSVVEEARDLGEAVGDVRRVHLQPLGDRLGQHVAQQVVGPSTLDLDGALLREEPSPLLVTGVAHSRAENLRSAHQAEGPVRGVAVNLQGPAELVQGILVDTPACVQQGAVTPRIP
jgi:hypothetical protein